MSTCPVDYTLWHRRLSHLNVDDVKRILRDDLATGLVIHSSASPDPVCEPCIMGKQHRVINKSSSRVSDSLELIHSDVHEVTGPATPEGYRYWVTFIEDASRFWSVYFLKSKSGVPEAFKHFKAWIENQTGKRIKGLQDDKGGEYMSKEFDTFLASCGIIRRHCQK